MIQFNCDNCETLIELDDDQSGTKHKCLNCGDINKVPSPTSSESNQTKPSPTTDRAKEAGFPPDQGPETRILKVRRCWFRSRAIRFSLLLLLLILAIVGIIWTLINDRSLTWLALFIPLTLVPLALITWWWLDRFTAAFEITTKRTIMHQGFFSKSSSEVVHDNIRNIQIDQTFLQRLTNVGRVGISSSGQDGVEIQVNHLPDPTNLKDIIDLYRPI